MPVLPTFSAYHDALIAKLDELKTSIDAISGPDSRTLTDIYNKLDTTDTALQDILLALRGSTAPTDNILWALRGVSAGKEASDTRNVIDAAPTLAGDIVVDMTTVETLLNTLLSDTADPTYVQLVDLYQKLALLEEYLATLVSDDIETNRTNLESLRSILAASDTKLTAIEAYTADITPAIEDLESSLLGIDFCCADGDGIGPIEDEPPDDITPAPANICQRAQWLVEQLRKVLAGIAAFSDTPAALTTAVIDKLYETYLGVTPPYTHLHRLYIVSRNELLADRFGGEFGIYNYYTEIIFWDSDRRGLVCALAGATSPQDAGSRWVNAELDAAPPLTDAGNQVIHYLVWNALLTDLFDGTIPADATELDAFSSTACSDCGTSGGGPFRLLVPTTGLSGGGVYEYTGGGNWELRTDGNLPAYSIAVAVNPSDTDDWLLLAATDSAGSVQVSGGVLVGSDGATGVLWHTTNGGQNWSNVPIAIASLPANSRLYELASGTGTWAISVNDAFGSSVSISYVFRGVGATQGTTASIANVAIFGLSFMADGTIAATSIFSPSLPTEDSLYYVSGSGLILAGGVGTTLDSDPVYLASYPTGNRVVACGHDRNSNRPGRVYASGDYRNEQISERIGSNTAWSVAIAADERIYVAGGGGNVRTGIAEISNLFGAPSVAVVAASGVAVGRIGIDRQTRTTVAALNSTKTAVYLWDGNEETIIDASSLTSGDLADFVEVIVDS
jgi:hypothetical protein